MGEVYVSVDIETSVPGEYSLLSLGACLVTDIDRTFYCELKPTGLKSNPRAVKVSKLSLSSLERDGLEPTKAMSDFAEWLAGVKGEDDKLVFVGLNAPFDWSFVNYYFIKYLGSNPFGFTALDLKAYYMGAMKCSWGDTAGHKIAAALSPQRKGNHNALVDAQYQAELFGLLLKGQFTTVKG